MNSIITIGREYGSGGREIGIKLSKAPCVIIGRSADYLLRDCENLISFFITAGHEKRVKRISKRHQVPAEKAEKMISRQDKIRANYYKCMTGNVWGMAANYDFCLNSSYYGIDSTVEIIKQIIQYS